MSSDTLFEVFDFGKLNIVARWNRFVKRRKMYNTTFRELSAMSDRELADIGVHRCEIGRVAAEAVEDVNPNLKGWV